MNVQFDWWLLIVGFVIGAGLTGLVLAELRRREDDLTAREREIEAAWIAADMTDHGIPADDPEVDALEADRGEVESVSGVSRTFLSDPAGQDRGPTPVASAADAREDARTLG